MYEIILTDKSFCPICDKHVHLLHDRNEESPMFYICHPCNYVGQVGVGAVTPLPDPRILNNVKLIWPFDKTKVEKI